MKTISILSFLLLSSFALSAQNHDLVNMRVLQGGELISTEQGYGIAHIFPASLDSYEISINYSGNRYSFDNMYVVNERVFQGHRIVELQGKKNVKISLTWDETEELTTISVRDGVIRTFTTNKIAPLQASNY